MVHIPFFYSDDMKILSEEDTHHFRNVLRKRTGDKFLICNGKGEIWWAKAKEIKNKNLLFELENLKEKKEKKTISIGTAIPKGQRISFLIEKLCEIGVDKIHLIETKYSSVKNITDGMLKRFNSIARAACMQSEKGFLTEIVKPVPIKNIIENFNNICILDINGKKESWQECVKNMQILLIGPEGGWAEDELNLFKEKNLPLLPLTEDPLRIETAAIFGLSFYYALKMC